MICTDKKIFWMLQTPWNNADRQRLPGQRWAMLLERDPSCRGAQRTVLVLEVVAVRIQ